MIIKPYNNDVTTCDYHMIKNGDSCKFLKIL